MKVHFPIAQLARSQNAQEFLKTLYRQNKQENSDFSYAYIAQVCGFRSKSYFNEVVNGKKGLTLEGSRKLSVGLRMPKAIAEFFHHLVEMDACPPNQKVKIQHRFEESRKKILKKSKSIDRMTFQTLYDLQNWPLVYCSLGDRESGATLKEIEKRCSLPVPEIQSVLEFLIEKKIVEFKDSRFFATENSLFVDGLTSSNSFRDFYLRELSRAYTAAQTEFKNRNQLFYNTVLSIDSKRMPEFRKALSELLNDFVGQTESPHGDKVASLVCSFRI